VWYQPRGVAGHQPWNFRWHLLRHDDRGTGHRQHRRGEARRADTGIARIMCDILWEAGAPRDVLHFCPAPGETTGLAGADPRWLIAFTGSKAVAWTFSRPRCNADEQPHVKGVCEMGQERCIIDSRGSG